MAVTGTFTVSEICDDALRKIGVVGLARSSSAEEKETARKVVWRLLKHWQNYGFNLWTVAEQTVTLTTAVSYTLSPARPVQIADVRFADDNGIETPMERMTREEYDALPDKDTTGRPTQWYYDKQREAAKLYIWPAMASVSAETLKVTYHREIEDAELADVIDVPAEIYNAVVYGIAEDLLDDFEITNPVTVQRIMSKAAILKAEALAADREGSIFFAGPYAT